MKESKEEEEEERPQYGSNDTDMFSNPSPTRVLPSSSSQLVPLYPHQHIITPLPHHTDSVTFDNGNDDDNSGYT